MFYSVNLHKLLYFFFSDTKVLLFSILFTRYGNAFSIATCRPARCAHKTSAETHMAWGGCTVRMWHSERCCQDLQSRETTLQ